MGGIYNPAPHIYRTPDVTPLPGAGGSAVVNHNAGTIPSDVILETVCLTAEFGYAIGDVVQCSEQLNVAQSDYLPCWFNTTQVGFAMAVGYTLSAHNKATGAHVSLTPANWSYRFCVQL